MEGEFGVTVSPEDGLEDRIMLLELIGDGVIEVSRNLNLVRCFLLVDGNDVRLVRITDCRCMGNLSRQDRGEANLSTLVDDPEERRVVKEPDLIRFESEWLAVQFRQSFQPDRWEFCQQGYQVFRLQGGFCLQQS